MDGVLRETLRMPAHVAPVVVSRVKVMARLDIAERRLPQDGRIGLTLGGKLIDVRVSTLPSRAGERVVLRILDKENAGIDSKSWHERSGKRHGRGARRRAPTGASWSPGQRLRQDDHAYAGRSGSTTHRTISPSRNRSICGVGSADPDQPQVG